MLRTSVTLVLLATLAVTLRTGVGEGVRAEETRSNDNRVPAGTLAGGVLTLHLEAKLGVWRPNGAGAPGASLPAFAEQGKAPQIPGPLVRVAAGTDVAVTIRNGLRDTLNVRGLHARTDVPPSAKERAGFTLAPGESRSLRVRLTTPGTYYYWGTTTHREINYRTGEDSQLTGVIVVDPAGSPPPPDRILVVGMWSDTVARAYVPRHRILAVVNGRTWPNTERFAYTVGDTVRWRVINASGDNHPMHLHGFYFRVDSRGDGIADTTVRAEDAFPVVTNSMSPGTTMGITWVPERPGNWLFHCHIPEHFGKRGPLGTDITEHSAHADHADHADHSADGMSGLVVGIAVKPAAGQSPARVVEPNERRRMRLVVRRNAGGTDETPFYGFALQQGAEVPPADSGLRFGPPLVLTRGEPVGIMVVNEITEATSIHWHGIELESYYDGVAGWSGEPKRIAPLVAPGDSFEVRFTPPRSGTFIYHTHVDELRQQPAGLSGPIVVLDPGQRWDPSTDHTVLITSPASFEEGRTAVLVNGSSRPQPLSLGVGVAHRLRIVNITTRRPALRLELRRDTTLLAWRELAKDGADLSERLRAVRPGTRLISIGETLDVEVAPELLGGDDLRLDVVLGGRDTKHPVLASLPLRVVRP